MKYEKPSIKINAVLNFIRYSLKIILPLITFPYIARVLMPENYGKISYCASIINYFMLLARLGINEYAVREGVAFRNEKSELEKFASEIFTIELIATFLSYLLLLIFLIFGTLKDEYKIILIIQSINLLLTTMGVEWIYIIKEDYRYITIRSFIVQIISIVCIYLFIKSQNDYFLYAGILTGAEGVGNLFNFVYAKKYIHLTVTKKMNIKKHLKSIAILFCNTALISIYINSDKTILGILEGDIAVGLYDVSVKVYTMIKGGLNAIVLVAMPRFSTYLRGKKLEEYRNLANKALNVQVVVMFPVITGLFMLSDNVVLLIAGHDYIQAASSLRILSIALVFAVFSNFYVYVIMISQRMDKQILVATILSALLNVLLNFITIPLFGINGAAYTTLLAELTVAVIGIYYCRNILTKRIDKKILWGTALGSVCIVLICLYINTFKISLLLDIFIKVTVSLIVYILILWRVNWKFFKRAKSEIEE